MHSNGGGGGGGEFAKIALHVRGFYWIALCEGVAAALGLVLLTSRVVEAVSRTVFGIRSGLNPLPAKLDRTAQVFTVEFTCT